MGWAHFRGAKGDIGPQGGPGLSAPYPTIERKYNVRVAGCTHPTKSPWHLKNVVKRKCSWLHELHRTGRRAQNVVKRNSFCCKEMTT